jgi:hypothetical protein
MAKKKPKAKIPRNKEKYPGLNVKRMVSNRREYVDYDYVEDLDAKAKDWLNRFTEEYYISNFKHKGKLIDGSDEARKESYHRNNARNRCEYSKAKSTKLLDNAPSKEYLTRKIDDNYLNNAVNQEDMLIELIEALKNDIKPVDD